MKKIYSLIYLICFLIASQVFGQMNSISPKKISNGSEKRNDLNNSELSTESVNTLDVTICQQVWMLKNLDVTTYSDGTPIPEVTDPTAWINLTTGAWCHYDNNPANDAIYGKLYNWYAVVGIYDAASASNPALRKQLAPTGWHIPSDTEWTALTTCLGGTSVAGGKLKEAGTTNWTTPNTGANNTSGFTALPAGARYGTDGLFQGIFTNASFWSTTQTGTTNAYCRNLYSNQAGSYRFDYDRKSGFSVRCLNDVLSNPTYENNIFYLYPNPSKNILNFNSNILVEKIRVYDILGQLVLEEEINALEGVINIEKLAKGSYLVKVNDLAKGYTIIKN